MGFFLEIILLKLSNADRNGLGKRLSIMIANQVEVAAWPGENFCGSSLSSSDMLLGFRQHAKLPKYVNNSCIHRTSDVHGG